MKTKKYSIPIFIMLLLSGFFIINVNAEETPGIIWESVIDEGYNPDCSAYQTNDGGFIIIDLIIENSSQGLGAHLIKTDSTGNVEWNKTYGGTELDYGYSVQQTSDGGYIISGQTESYGDVSGDLWLIKTDENGIEVWNKTFGSSNFEEGECVQQTSDDGFITVGRWNYGDMWLLKTDENGIEEWNKSFGENYLEFGKFVRQTNDGGFIVVGEEHSQGTTHDADIWLIKTNSVGNKQWDKIFGGSDDDEGYVVQQTSDGGYILTGMTNYNVDTANIFLIKTDSNGSLQWDKTFKYGIYCNGKYVIETTDGGYAVLAYVDYGGENSWDHNADILLIKTDNHGNIQWTKRFGGSNTDIGGWFTQTSDGNFVIVGKSWDKIGGGYPAPSTMYDIWMFKVNPDEYQRSDENVIETNDSLDANGDGTSTPGFEPILVLCAITLVLFWRRKVTS